MKAEEMAKIYATTFKKLAVDYHVTISAGSIVLPAPHVENNEIVVDTSQPIFNAGFIFKPDGNIDPQVVKKSFPIKSELPFLHASPIEELPVFNLPIGRTVILVCADSWYPESYARVDHLGADVVLVPSYCAGTNSMSQKWNGYDGIHRPADVDTTDIQNIAEQNAWIKYALPGRIVKTKSPVGVNVFLRGELWDLGSDGQPFFVFNKERMQTGNAKRAGIWNFCF
jgi:predicted amidohydrolase